VKKIIQRFLQTSEVLETSEVFREKNHPAILANLFFVKKTIQRFLQTSEVLETSEVFREKNHLAIPEFTIH